MKKTICNPLDLEYRYQYRTDRMGGYSVAREAADPTMLRFQDTYFLFASMSGGFWYSDDLYAWNFKETPELPIYDYAPDVRAVGERVIFSASRRGEPCSFYASANPLTQPFSLLSTPFDFWDPNLFEDEDGRVYFYWGCTNSEPIWGVEIDTATFLPLGEKRAMFGENEAQHGWERKGENNIIGEPKDAMERMIRQYVGTKPFIEGAYMTKHGGRYYLQYAAPGTECNVYADGVYVADAPLGPFVYQAHNPFSSKPGGFITSAGHGSTFQDKYGNWWHVSTMRVSVNENFERRIGLFPCGFDAQGTLYCNQNLADYPFALPAGPVTTPQDITPCGMLLSYGKPATASSAQEGFMPAQGTDEDIRTWWAAREEDDAPWYQLDLGSAYEISAVQVNLADHCLVRPKPQPEPMVENQIGARHIFVQPQKTGYVLQASEDGTTWSTLVDTRAENSDRAHRLWVPNEPVQARFMRLCKFMVPFGGVPAVSGLRVFGKSSRALPAPVSTQRVQVSRSADGRNILLHWDVAAGAQGYNVRYGLAPETMYNSWQVIEKTSLDLSMVNAGQPYYIAIDSYGESGITPGEPFYVQ